MIKKPKRSWRVLPVIRTPPWSLGLSVEAPGIEPDQAVEWISLELADPASTRLDFDSIEPSSFHLDLRFGARSSNTRAT